MNGDLKKTLLPNLEIYFPPNSSDGIINFDIENPLNALIEIYIYNTNGSLIYFKSFKLLKLFSRSNNSDLFHKGLRVLYPTDTKN